MEKKIQQVLDEAQGVMDGLTAVLFFRLANIPVEADPLSLLSVTVKIEDNERSLEDVATPSKLDKYSFAFVPKDNDYIFPIIRGLKREHPDFEIEQGQMESAPEINFSAEERAMLGMPESDEQPESQKYLICKMPEMNDSRRETYTDLTEATCETSKKQIGAKKTKFEAVLLKRSIGMPEDQVEEAKEQLDSIVESSLAECDKSKETKIASIEEAYQLYLSTQEQDQSAESDDEGDGSGLQMNMNE